MMSESLHNSSRAFETPISSAAARDEGFLENGRRRSRYLVSCGLLGQNAIGGLTPEPIGGVGWYANRGAISLRPTLSGKATHVGRQFEGANAFEQSVPAFFGLTLDVLEGFEVGILQEEPAAATSAETPLGAACARQIETITGKSAVFEICPGLLETRFYAARGIPALAYGPGLLTVSHGPNEFVPICNIAQCAAIYALTAAELLR